VLTLWKLDSLWRECSDLLFPQRCHGCSRLGEILCLKCRSQYSFRLKLREIGDLKVLSATSFSPVSRKILLSAKESGVRSADQLVVDALKFSLAHLSTDNNFLLQPVPSQKSKIRLRGRSFISELTEQLCSEKVAQIDLLEFHRRVLDQSRLSAQERSENLAGAYSVRVKKFPISEEIFLVDDVVTTGATLLEARRALTAAGFTVAGAITAFSA